jgi:WD40 repeat protein
MTAHDALTPEDQFHLWLAACDEALVAGDMALPPQPALPPEEQSRRDEGLAWCRLVRQLWPRANCSTFSAATTPGAAAPAAGLSLTRLGRFEIQRELGRGGCGVVFLAYDPKLRRPVALKVPRTEALFTSELRARFQHEARAAAALDHPNLVPVYEAGEEGSLCYIASAYCPGITLAAWLKERSEPVPYRLAAQLLLTLAEAMDYAHRQGVLHRDLKPSNIMLEKDEGGRMKDEKEPPSSSSFILHPSSFVPKITDFGLAKLVDGEPGATTMPFLTQSGAVLGTPSYMAPEQAGGQSKAAGPAADVYALGAILYELLTGRPPFKADTPLETLLLVRTSEPVSLARLRQHVPRDLETICLKCLRKEPAKRYGSALALAEDLRRYLAGEPIRARRIGTLGRLVLWCRRKPALASTLAVATLVCLSVAGVGLWRVLEERDRYRTEREKAVRHLYHSLIGEARALRLARRIGYRSQAWDRLRQALALDTSERNPLALRHEAAACLGDFVGLEPAIWTDFPEGVYAIDLAVPPEGGQVALALTDGTVSLRRLPGGAEIARLRGHRSGVFAVAFGPRGDLLLSGDDRGTIKVWKKKADRTWVCVRTLVTAPSGMPNYIHAISAAFTPDGSHLLFCSKTASAISLTKVQQSTYDFLFPRHDVLFRGPGNERFYRLAVSPDGKLLAGVYRDEGRDGLLVWDLASRKMQMRLSPNLGILNDVVFSPDGKYLACAGYDGVALFDTEAFQQRWFEHGDASFSLAFSPDSQWLAIPNSALGVVRLWNITANRAVADLTHPGEPHSVAFSRDGRSLVSVAARSVRVWNLAGSGEKVALSGHKGSVSCVAFRSDGKLLASASADETVKFWDPGSGRLVSRLSGFRGSVQAVAFHPGGNITATADWSGAVRIWDLTLPGRPKELTSLTHEAGTILWGVAFSPDGRYFSVCGESGVELWEVRTGKSEQRGARSVRPPVFANRTRLTDHQGSTLCFSPDSKLFAWGEKDSSLRYWQLRKSRRIDVPGADPGAPQGIAFLPDSKHLAFISSKYQAEIWNMVARKKTFGLDVAGFQGPYRSTPGRLLALSADGAWLAVQGSVVTIWDTKNKDVVLALPKEPSGMLSMAWDPDRNRLAIGSADGRLVVWNLPVIRTQLGSIGLSW